tara:strand:+ start:590 stop:1018 length:429 start_codon:yes stop_codon:yes gene_type:complete
MIIDKYLYFRTQADQNDDDGIDDSLYLPARQITAIVPTSTTAITIFFESMYNTFANVAEDLNVISDSVVVNCTAGKVKQVMETLVRAINSNKLYGDGTITVADDVTTTYLTSSAGADETVSAKILDSGITTCGAITIAAANS